MDIFATHGDITRDYRDYINSFNYQPVEPVLPVDILGIYLILPEVKP